MAPGRDFVPGRHGWTARRAALLLLLVAAHADARVERFTLGDLAPAEREALRVRSWPAARLDCRPGLAAHGSQSALFPGDRLTISKDDGVVAGPPLGFEGRLRPGSGPAGASDYLAFRFATGEIGRMLPVTVTGLTVAFDNRYGRAVWPLVALAREDRAVPLRPDLGALVEVRDLADPLAIAPPAGAAPDRIERLAVDLADTVIDPDPSLDDSGLSDDFDRPDEPLGSTPWLECGLDACPGPQALQLAGNRVVKTRAVAAALGLRTVRDEAVYRLRPFDDRDQALGVRFDVGAPTAAAAGIAFRVEEVFPEPPPGRLSRYYLASYQKRPQPEVHLWAVVDGVATAVTAPVGVAARDTGALEVEVEGVNPTRIRVRLDAVEVIDHRDSTWSFGGWRSGLASYHPTEASSGEAWDDFTVLRNRDLFVVVQLPPGEDASLPAERSPASLPWGSVLFSSDGASWSPEPDDADCDRPALGRVGNTGANGLVQVVVEDATVADDNVFRAEYKLDRIDVGCPSCPLARDSRCRLNPSAWDASAPVLESGRQVEVKPWWWNEHVPDLDDILVRVVAYQGGCFGAAVAGADVVTASAGQAAVGAEHRTAPAPMLTFTPAAPGLYCLVALEFYDLNRDGCPDGFEPPGGACTPVPNPDQSFATQGLLRLVEVYPPCTPVTVSNLEPSSLRLTRAAAGATDLAWARLDAGRPPGSYNLHLTEVKAVVEPGRLRTEVPPWREVVGLTASREQLPEPAGPVLFLGLFENDGCASGQSLPDP
jgi:hypothetical protein